MSFVQFENIRINRTAYIEWLYDREFEQFKVIARKYNRDIYVKKLDEKHYKIYRSYINERLKYLIGEEILDKDYSMILLDNTMYKVLDHFHFMELVRVLTPVDSIEFDDIREGFFDIVLDATLRTGEVFGETDLVFHNGIFYNDGNIVKTIRDFKRDGIEYEQWDLLNGLTKEQLRYLLDDYEYRGFVKKYVTKDVNLNIDRWY
jgi:hypothetical protein